MKLDIFENTRQRSKKPLLHIGTVVAYYNIHLIDKLKLTSDSRILFSVDRDTSQWYLCVLPELSNMKGFKLSRVKGGNNLFLVSSGMKRYIENGLEEGYYFIGEPEFDGNLDWFELIKAEINEL